jgi:2-polyprenyl-3-methyl-5-hydroxy-6-metoxy-1,4-benzoquinol methylase
MVMRSIGNKDITNRRKQHSTGKQLVNIRLEDYDTLKPILETFNLQQTAKIINLGCGNSELCETMYDQGYHNIANIDICENVIKFMKERNIERKGLTCNINITFSRDYGCPGFKIRG